jgi:uncharacterized protein (DUF2062 family)
MSLKLMRWLHQRGLSRKRLKGGRLHRWFGDHLFNRHLWRLEREAVARAMFLGCLSSLSPFFGFHLLIGCSLAMCFRANIPVTVALQFLTNPATVIFYYPAAYMLGAELLGHQPMRVEKFRELIQVHDIQVLWAALSEIGWPLLLGCSLCGLALGSFLWALTRLLWPVRKTPPDSADSPPSQPPPAVPKPE